MLCELYVHYTIFPEYIDHVIQIDLEQLSWPKEVYQCCTLIWDGVITLGCSFHSKGSPYDQASHGLDGHDVSIGMGEVFPVKTECLGVQRETSYVIALRDSALAEVLSLMVDEPQVFVEFTSSLWRNPLAT